MSNNNTISNNDINNNGNPTVLSSFYNSFNKPGSINVVLYSGIFMDPSNDNYLINNNIHDNHGVGATFQDANGNHLSGNYTSKN